MKNPMKIIYSLFLLIVFFAQINSSSAQSNPQALDTSIIINRVITVHDGAIRIGVDPITHNLYYVLTDGSIYRVIRPTAGAAYDSLVFSTAQHGVEYIQGMTFHDSTLYLAGNNHSTTPLTYGIIVRGKLQPNGSRLWDTLMHTSNYQTADFFDHLFTGIAVNSAGDTIYACSGARGDHGEIQHRYGAYPGLRGVPITTLILAMPTKNPNIITLQNDSASLAASGYIYSRGIRSTFDMAFDSDGNLFGVENSGDYDHNEEMNLLLRNHHYGYPWKMGDSNNPQQFPGFNPATDKLINHYSRAWRNGFWDNDPTFPQPPAGVTFDAPIKNYGPDCDKYRDSSGAVHDASDNGIPLSTFSAHRSPLGLVFDNSKVLSHIYKGDGFMLSWTKGYDSCGCTAIPDTSAGTFVDPSQDLVHLDLSYDSTAGNFRLNATRIIGDFEHPVDADIDSNRIFVLENGYDGTSGIYEILMPFPELPCWPTSSFTHPDICNPDSNFIFISSFGNVPNDYLWYDSSWTLLRSDTGLTSGDSFSLLPSGTYNIIIDDAGACATDTLHLVIPEQLSFRVDSLKHTTCIGCTDGIIYFTVIGGTPPYNVNVAAGTLAGNTIINLPPGNYSNCVADDEGCTSCHVDTILDDPTYVFSFDDNKDFILYPNPVSGSATLNFNLEGSFSINLLDINGKQIRTLSNESKDHGMHKMNIDCNELSKGCYIIEINIDNRKIFRKLFVMD